MAILLGEFGSLVKLKYGALDLALTPSSGAGPIFQQKFKSDQKTQLPVLACFNLQGY